MSLESDGHALFTSVAWDLAHEQLVLADAAGVVQVWNTYTGSVCLTAYTYDVRWSRHVAHASPFRAARNTSHSVRDWTPHRFE